jgi:hypothetical protein
MVVAVAAVHGAGMLACPRAVQDIIMGLIIGSIFYNTPDSKFQVKMGLLFFVLMVVCFGGTLM